MNFLKKISRQQWDELKKANLIKYRICKEGRCVQEPNFYICNKTHKGSRKTYYVVEEKRILNFLKYGTVKNGGFKKHNNKFNGKNDDRQKVYQRNFKEKQNTSKNYS